MRLFSQLKNIDTAFKHVRRFSIVLIASLTLVSGLAIYKSYELTRWALSRVWVLADGKAMRAAAASRKENLAVEARGHVMGFHRLFFTLDPDQEAITESIGRALYLADGSAKRQYDNLKESGYYAGLIAGNISQRIRVDSVRLDMHREPYRFTCYATIRLVRSSSVTRRSLVTSGSLRNTQRSDHNRHGFLIERWEILENRTLSTRSK